MRKLAFLSIIYFSFLLFTSCSSLDSDAKEAADLNKKSLEYVKAQNLEKAEEAYKESQKIVARYKGTEQYAEFQKIYTKHMMGAMLEN